MINICFETIEMGREAVCREARRDDSGRSCPSIFSAFGGSTMDRLTDVRKNGRQHAKGRKELLAHLEGTQLTQRQMIQAKCYDCTGYYADGKQDCSMPDCPLYPLMPYRKGEKYRSRTAGAGEKKKRPKRMDSGMRQNTLSLPRTMPCTGVCGTKPLEGIPNHRSDDREAKSA